VRNREVLWSASGAVISSRLKAAGGVRAPSTLALGVDPAVVVCGLPGLKSVACNDEVERPVVGAMVGSAPGGAHGGFGI
jgi:hypothetical protein